MNIKFLHSVNCSPRDDFLDPLLPEIQVRASAAKWGDFFCKIGDLK